MTKDEIINKYGINEFDLPKEWIYIAKKDEFNSNCKCYLNWEEIFKQILNHRTGGNSRDIILREFAKS